MVQRKIGQPWGISPLRKLEISSIWVITIQDGAPKIAKLVYMCLTMVYGRYNYSIHGDYHGYNQQTITGGPHPIYVFLWFFPFEDHPFWMILWFHRLQWTEEWKYQRKQMP